MSDVALRVEGLGKRYRIGAATTAPTGRWDAARRLAGAPFAHLARMRRPPTEAETLWALRDVSFTVGHGEVVGLIGRNGAGKSTLLKILSRITEPTTGRAELHGRVGSLLEVGTGFHPELTGRENVYLNGAILGMRRAEVDRKFDEIVAFAGVESFLDTPVKRYSSGMYVRLAFAVAAHLETEILLVDEVLAVGDAEFQRRCIGRMGEVAREGRTVVMVSHNMASIEALCPHAILLDRGRATRQGAARDVIKSYFERNKSSSAHGANLAGVPRNGRYQRVFVAGWINGTPLMHRHVVEPATGLVIELEVDLQQGVRSSWFDIMVGNERVGNLFGSSSRWALHSVDLDAGRHRVVCEFPSLPLVAGEYYVSLGLVSARQQIDHLERCTTIEVLPFDAFGTGQVPTQNQGYYLVDAAWRLADLAEADDVAGR